MFSALILIIILCVNPLSLMDALGPLCRLLHQACVDRVLSSGEGLWPEVYSALLCGENLQTPRVRRVFVSVGVIHLMVISGAHLIFIEKAFGCFPKFPFKNFILCVLLCLYALSAGLRPPVLRALFSLLLVYSIRRFKGFMSPYLRVQISGLLCLVCEGGWYQSLSLQLSWLASMGMCRRDFSRLKSCTLTYLLLLPIISQWGGSHPLSILVNWLVAPLASCLLLPLSFLSLLFPSFRFVTDRLWTWFIEGLNRLQPLMENQDVIWLPRLSSFQIWLYIVVVFMVLQMALTAHRRGMKGSQK